MMHTCPNHEFSRKVIIQNFYARVSHDEVLLDSSSTGSFINRTIEFKWDLLERIKRNSEDWEFDKGKESGINLKFDCVESFMETDTFHEFSNKYGPESEIVASFCESFATHVDIPKEKWFKYHPPIEEQLEKPIKLEKEEIIVSHVDPIVPTAYTERPPFHVRTPTPLEKNKC